MGLLQSTPPSMKAPLIPGSNLIGVKRVGAADVAWAASQMVHGMGAESHEYVRSNTGGPPSAFDSSAQTNLEAFHQ